MDKNILQYISTLLKKNIYSPKIIARLEKDLQKVQIRLESGQYEYHDYSGENTFQVDERTEDFFLYLKSYAETGKLWEKILQNVDVHSFSSIVDLCCGWAPKISLALVYLDYKGELVLFDSDEKALSDLESFMTEVFRPKYHIKKEQGHIEESSSKYECVVANHVFDDLILSFYCKQNNISGGNLYKDESFLQNAWKKISCDDIFLKNIAYELANVFDTLMLKEGIICFSQYESMMEKIMKNTLSVDMSMSTFQKTRDILLSQGYRDISHIALKWIEEVSPKQYFILKK